MSHEIYMLLILSVRCDLRLSKYYEIRFMDRQGAKSHLYIESCYDVKLYDPKSKHSVL